MKWIAHRLEDCQRVLGNALALRNPSAILRIAADDKLHRCCNGPEQSIRLWIAVDLRISSQSVCIVSRLQQIGN